MMKKGIIKALGPSKKSSQLVPPSHLCYFDNSTRNFRTSVLFDVSKFYVIINLCVYIYNIITQDGVNLLTNLDKQRAFLGINNMIYDRPSEMVPEEFFGLFVVVFYNHKTINHILESVYNMTLVEYQYQPL